MKKTLLKTSIALAAATVATVASAQSSVTIYGLLDAGVVSESNGNPVGNSLRLDSGNQNGSRLGFKGTEDLGGGLSANFVLETGLLLDTGGFDQGNLAFGRQAYVGLNAGWGSMRLGRQKTVSYDVLEALDPFKIGLAGDASRMFSLSGKRVNNSVAYLTPNLSGFNGELLYGFGEVVGNTQASRQWGLAGTYSNGPLYLGLSYTNQNDATASDAAKVTLMGGTYDFNVAKLHMAYAINKGTGTLDTRDFMIGATIPFDQSNVLISYIRKNDKFLDNANANEIALGYTYALSKRTNVYTSYSRISNDANAKYNAAVAGANDRLINLGLRHLF